MGPLRSGSMRSINTSDSMRGRVTAIYLQGAIIGHAAGSLVNAKMSDLLSVRGALFIDASLLLVLLAAMQRVRGSLDHEGTVDPTGVDIAIAARIHYLLDSSLIFDACSRARDSLYTQAV